MKIHKGRQRIYKDDPKTPAMYRLKKAALQASDNGRCWWIYQFLIGTGH